MVINQVEISCVPHKLFINKFVSAYHKSKKAGKFYLYLMFRKDGLLNSLQFDRRCLIRGRISPVPIFGQILRGIEVDEIIPMEDDMIDVNYVELTVDVEKDSSDERKFHFYNCRHYRKDKKPIPINIKSSEELPIKNYVCVHGYYKAYKNILTGYEKTYVHAEKSVSVGEYALNPLMTFSMRAIGYGGTCPYIDLPEAEEDRNNVFSKTDKEKLFELDTIIQQMLSEMIDA